MEKPIDQARAAVPSVDKILRLDGTQDLLDRFGRELVTDAVRQITADLRGLLADDEGGLDKAEKGKKWVLENATWEISAQKTIEAYGKIL